MDDLGRLIPGMLHYALLCVGVLWFIRAGIFAIVADSARVLVPTTVVVGVALGMPVNGAILLGFVVWLGVAGLFWVARDVGGADDILLSLGVQAVVVGLASFAAFRVVHQRYLESPLSSPSAIAVVATTESMLIVGSVYLLSFSHLRVPLAHAAAYRGPSDAYPSGGRTFRAGAAMAGAVCLALASLAPLTAGSIGIDQWKDGLGILALGMAYALRRRNAAVCVLSGGLVAAVQFYCDSNVVLVRPGPLAEIVGVMHLFAGLAVIVTAVLWSRFRERPHRPPGAWPPRFRFSFRTPRRGKRSALCRGEASRP